LWGIPTYYLYAPRRVECASHGVVVEHIPWSDGKRLGKDLWVHLSTDDGTVS